jgi:hypothetical protein
MLVAFCTYMLCEQIGLSGVVSIFVLGVVLSHYAYHTMAYDAKLGSVMAVEMMSFIAETVVYIFCGRHLALRVVYQTEKQHPGRQVVNSALWLTLTAVVILARLASVLLIGILSRLVCLKSAFDWKRQTAMWHGGCVRGTVAFALAIALPGENSFSPCVDATLAVVLITTLFVTPLFNVTLRCVKLETDAEASDNQIRRRNGSTVEKSIDGDVWGSRRGSDSWVEASSSAWLRVRNLDDSYMKPLFGGRATSLPQQASGMDPESNVTFIRIPSESLGTSNGSHSRTSTTHVAPQQKSGHHFNDAYHSLNEGGGLHLGHAAGRPDDDGAVQIHSSMDPLDGHLNPRTSRAAGRAAVMTALGHRSVRSSTVS